MDAENFFARLRLRFAHRASSLQSAVQRQTEADTLIAKAEYEYHDVQRELLQALKVPLAHRAVRVTQEP